MDDNSGSIRADRADFVPVIAGVSYMRYPVFLGFDIVGGVAWGAGVTLAGYFLGSVPFVHMNFQLIILALVFVSLLPALVSAARVYRARRNAPQSDPDPLVLPE